jgi:hypothetical protein
VLVLANLARGIVDLELPRRPPRIVDADRIPDISWGCIVQQDAKVKYCIYVRDLLIIPRRIISSLLSERV